MTSTAEPSANKDKEVDTGCPLASVRRTTEALLHAAAERKQTQVTIDITRLDEELEQHSELYAPREAPDWDCGYHFFDSSDIETTAQYILVLDALNFCFWPLPDYQYEHLAGSLKSVLLADRHAFGADKLAALTAEQMSDWLQPSRVKTSAADAKSSSSSSAAAATVKIPLVEERARLLREVGRGLKQHFDGKAANLVRAAKGRASTLVELVTAHFPGFRDHSGG